MGSSSVSRARIRRKKKHDEQLRNIGVYRQKKCVRKAVGANE
jgi:hypothetical protein